MKSYKSCSTKVLLVLCSLAVFTLTYAITIIPNYGDGFGEGTPQRAVFEAKIAQWANYECLCHYTITINVSMGALLAEYKTPVEYVFGINPSKPDEQETLAVATNFIYGPDGYPTGADITFNGNPAIPWDWSVTLPINPDAYDGVTVANHEIAHAAGFSHNPANDRFNDNIDPGPPRQYNLGGGRFVSMTPPGPTGYGNTHTDPTTHPFDIMNPGLSTGDRRPMSELVLDMLRLAFPTTGKASGKAIDDLNLNGLLEIDEPPLRNIKIKLFDSTFTVIDSILTDSLGRYKFTGLTPGNYIIMQKLSPSRMQSYPANYAPHMVRLMENEGKNGLWFGSYVLTAPPTGWTQKESMPSLGAPKKYVKDGGALVAVGSNLYAFRGNNSREFYKYSENDKTDWTSVASIPWDSIDGRPIKKNIKKGAALCYDGASTIYATKGGGSKEFWAYNIASNSWTKKNPVIVPKGLKGGTQMDFYNGKIYLLAGGQKPTDHNYFIYNTSNNTWDTAPSRAPLLFGKPYKDGTVMTKLFIPATECTLNVIYRIRKCTLYTTYHFKSPPELYCSWIRIKQPLPSPPELTKWKDTKDGAAVASAGDKSYLITGGGSQQFWLITPQPDTTFNISPLETIPRLNKKSVPKTGAALAYANDKVYLLKGNNTPEFWQYIPAGKSKSQIPSSKQIQNSNVQIQTSSERIAVNPNPFTKLTTIRYSVAVAGKVTLKLYDVAGKLVKTLNDGYHNTGVYSMNLTNINSGVYFLKLVLTLSNANGEESHQTEVKLIVQ